MSDFHPISEKIESLIREQDLWYERFEHDPVRTSEEAAKIRPDYTQHQGSKSLIVSARALRGDPVCDKRFIMLVVPGDMQFDKRKVKAIGFDDLRFANEAEIGEITHGVLPGGVPPFGNLFGLPVFVDKGVVANERIIFNAGDRRVSIALRSTDYLRLVRPEVVDIAREKA